MLKQKITGMLDRRLLHKNRKRSYKTIIAACTALAALSPIESHAKLSILGVLDTRPSFAQTPVAPISPTTATSPVIPTQALTPTQHIPHQTQTVPENATDFNASGFSAEEVGFHKELGVITARGNVEIIHEDRVLIADTVSYNQNKNLVTASGNVQLIEPNGDVLFTEFLEITSDLKSGIAQQLRMSLSDNSHLVASKAKRTEGRFLIAKDAEYSPCQKCQDNPERPLAWKLSAKEVTHDAEQKRMEYSDVFLELYDIPVLYFPYFTHPDPTQRRETGFLTPSFGSRGTLEGFVSAPFFWNISPSKDLTLEPTYYYNLEQGHLNAEYRQHTQTGQLRLGGSLTYADGGAGATDSNKSEVRGHIDSEGLFHINDTWRWGFEANHATDETYVRRYGVTNRTENAHLTSNLFTEGFRKRNYMKAQLSSYQEQRDGNDNDLQDGKFEYLFNHISQPQKSGAYWKTNASLYSINSRNDSSASRLAADTSWVIPYTSPTGDLITLDTNIIASLHYANNLNNSGLSEEYSGAQARFTPSMSLEWRKPLSRTQMGGRVNEIFEPIIKLKAAPNIGENHKIANEDSQDFEFDDTNLFKTNRFAGLDKVDGGQRLDFGFNWGLFGEEGGYSQMFIGQSYRLRDDSTYDSNSGHQDNMSDIVGRVIVEPSNFLSVLYRYRLDKANMSLNRSETQLAIGPASSRFSMGHLFVEGTGQSSEYATREEIHGTLSNQISKNWYSTIDGRYRMSDPEGSVSYGGRLGYKDECTTIYFDFRRNFSDDRDIDPTDVMTLRFELKNLGGFGTL
ncbi:LPS assembly protein LptD [Terasakiella sp. SH-1]|uniref:LPS-assembly protein LptD n=1 Tax=Terasakiella sp. SH-1 TaxID=2560057 RepID=UPI00107481DC|nr:LPS assembly protein LptD [Terasakiella sp. SH-1]